MYLVQRVQMEAINSFLYFTTLTYDNSHLPHLFTSTGYDIRFADIRHLQLMMKRLRQKNAFGRPFRYLAVSERGSEKARPHFHILWFLPKYKGETFPDGLSLNSKLYDVIKANWCINVGSDTKPIYESLFVHRKKFYRGKLFTNYDTHFVVPSLTSSGLSSVAFYVCKYMFKVSDKEQRLQQAFKLNLPAEEYESSWSLVKSRHVTSTSFGLGAEHNSDDIKTYLKKCIAISDRSLHYPQFFNPDTNQSFPLAPFYKNNADLFPLSVADEFLQDSLFISDDRDISEKLIAVSEFERISNIVDTDLSINFDFLFD